MNSARKIKLRVTPPRPRNPLVAPTAQRKAGAHRKSAGARRRAQEDALRRALRRGEAEG